MEGLIEFYEKKFGHTSISDLTEDDVAELKQCFGDPDWKDVCRIYLNMKDD